MLNCRDCYEAGAKGDAEWEAHKVEYKNKRAAVKGNIISDLGIDTEKGSVSITQAIAEVFTVVNIWELSICCPIGDTGRKVGYYNGNATLRSQGAYARTLYKR